MAGIDYESLALTAKNLIEENGRPCTFSRVGQVSADPTKPWRGPTTDPASGSPPVSYPGVIAVVALEEYSDAANPGVRRPAKMTVLVAADSFPASAVDLRTLDHVDDGQTNWRICKMLPVMPGSTAIIYASELEG